MLESQAKTSQNKENRDRHTSPEKGTAYYPISDLQFDVVALVYEKSKALQAYDKYLRDAQPNEELAKLIDQMKQDDKRHVESLKQYLGGC